MLSSLGYNLKQGFRQIFRNRGMSLASIFSITAMLLILGLFFVITVNINMFSEAVKQDFEQIEVFLLDETTQEQTMQMMAQIEDYDGVAEVAYRTEEEALEIMKERWGESGYLLDSLGENPLPSSILITVDTLEQAGAVAEYAAGFEGVEDIRFYQETVEKLTEVTDFIQLAALVIMAFLVVVSVVVVSNMVKLTVFARAKEIEIMKYIGATNWFIRGPFMLEGIIIGAFSALLSAGIVTFVYTRVLDVIGTSVTSVLSMPLVPVSFLGLNLMWIFLALGVSIGAWGSIVSMRRFLDT